MTNPLDLVGPFRGPCGLCGDRAARHRIADAIVDRIAAGDDEGALSLDYDRSLDDVLELCKRWKP